MCWCNPKNGAKTCDIIPGGINCQPQEVATVVAKITSRIKKTMQPAEIARRRQKITQKVDLLSRLSRDLRRELEKLQAACSHPTIKGTHSAGESCRVCVDCDMECPDYP